MMDYRTYHCYYPHRKRYNNKTILNKYTETSVVHIQVLYIVITFLVQLLVITYK